MKARAASRGRRGWLLPGIVAAILTVWLARMAWGEGATETRAPDAAATGAAAGEALAIIVNKANPVSELSLEDLRKYFRLERDRWSNDKKITVVMLPAGTPERELVLREIYHFTEGEFSQFFIQKSFAGRGGSAPKELINSVNVRKFVFNVPGAIGFIRAGEVDDSVKVLRVGGRAPTDKDYPLKITEPAAK